MRRVLLIPILLILPLVIKAQEPMIEVRQLDSAKVVNWRDHLIRIPSGGSIGISGQAVMQAPVLFGEKDLFKTLQMLPGVSAASEGFAGISVRGGYADENLILLDGVPVYNSEHLFGIFSIFPPEAVKEAELYKGAFPARFGGRASSVLDITTQPGNRDSLRGSFTVGLLADKVHLDGPLGEKTSFAVSGRVLHSFLAEPILLAMKQSTNLWFYDINARLDRFLSDKDILSLTFYNGSDSIRDDKREISFKRVYDEDYAPYDQYVRSNNGSGYNWGNTQAALHWQHGEALHSSIAWTGYNMRNRDYRSEETELEGTRDGGATTMEAASDLSDLALNADYHLEHLDFGIQGTLHAFHPQGQNTHIVATEKNETVLDSLMYMSRGERRLAAEFALWADGRVNLGDKFSLHPGLRLGIFASGGKTWFLPEPRISMLWEVYPGWTTTAAYTRMSQCIHRIPSRFTIMPTDEWRPASAVIPPLTSDQFSLSLHCTVLPGWNFTAETFYKNMNGVLDYRVTYSALGSSYSQWSSMVASGEGRAYGLELLARRTRGRLTGWLAYSLARSERRFPDGSINDGKWYPATTDRRHKLNLCATYSFNERVDLTAAWTYASGAPITVATRHAFILTDKVADQKGLLDELVAPSVNNYRLPAMHRADVSVNFRKTKPRGDRVWSLGVYNLYGARNPEIYYYNFSNSDAPGSPGYNTSVEAGTPVIVINSLLMFLPSVSYTRNF